MTAIDTHPQRQQIIEQILAGTPLRTIGTNAVPPLHHTTLSRFKLKLVAPAVKRMRGSSPKHQEIKDIARASGVFGDASEGAAEVQDAMRQRVYSAVDKLDDQFAGWIQDADNRAVLDKLGMPVRDSDGTVVRYKEHRALAAHSSNMLKSLEFRARLAGLLQDGAHSAQIITNIQLVMPRRDDEPAGQVIDITPE